MASWNAFYRKTEKRGASALLSRALELVDNQAGVRQAVDLGCGAGNETRQLVQAGWQVLAIDREPEAIARTTENCSGEHAGGLTTWLADFESMRDLPGASLIHAGLALPFCHPDRFQHLWSQVLNALTPGGVFAGHFFGVRHGWSTLAHLTFHTEPAIRSLCGGMEIVLLRETESSVTTHAGPLNWHRFDLIVRKPFSLL
ncbi:trans-aconitate 2-methyltransferase [Pseudomonas sp. MRSN 12121]|uniref:class I SAM-dependent methyltransferase n=1 Tax=Pseudomonas sp. MRSN 12121 TaxID=1611770 RepID=UPI0005BEB3E1|nr:methyltransferase domain-containing protein [Pseudomonas sp. MRSN 12121]AJO77925.1 tellurium resistance protein TehB [Pseudomonas sp. MRSN 12121]